MSMASAPGTEDAIDRLVARLSKNPLWINGLSPNIELAETTPTKDVVAKVFDAVSFDQGKVTRHTILRERKVTIGQEPRPYTAVLVDTNLGRKVVLVQHQGKSGWWSRVFPEE
jgi:hypothetical protein